MAEQKTIDISPRELAHSGLFGAAALLLPSIFHLLHLGHIFMPMYLPLVALAFFVGPKPAAVTAFVVPLLSGAVTGMPPFFPPTAPCMAIELSVMAATIAAVRRRWPMVNEWMLLASVLIIGRVINFGAMHCFARLVGLPASFLAGLSFIVGWPGLALMMVTIPSLVRSKRILRASAQCVEKES